MNYPTVEINNEFPKRVFFTSSVNIEPVPREPDSTYGYPQSFRADLPDTIQPADDSQNVSWHIVSMGITPNAIHNPPEPNTPLASGRFEYRLVVDPDLLRNSLIYGKLDNPVSSILTNPTPTSYPSGGVTWPNADIAAHALHYDMAHLARIALVTQVFENQSALNLRVPMNFKTAEEPVYNWDTVQFAILPNRLIRGPLTSISPINDLVIGGIQRKYDLQVFYSDSLRQDVIDGVENPSRNALPGTLYDYWQTVALPAICQSLSSGIIELEEPYFPTREKFLTRLFEKANLHSLFRCHIPDFSDDLTNRVTLELRENATLHFFQAQDELGMTLDLIRKRLVLFCAPYIHYSTVKDKMAERLGVAPVTARPSLLINQTSYFLRNAAGDEPVPDGPVFPFTKLSSLETAAGPQFHQAFIYDQANALADRLLEYFFSITIIQDISLYLNTSAQAILGDNAQQNWMEQLSRSSTLRDKINERGPTGSGTFLPLWSRGINQVDLQFQKNCSQISSFTKNESQNSYSYTPPIPLGEYIEGGSSPDPDDSTRKVHNLWLNADKYHLAIPFTMQSILDYYASEPVHFYVNVIGAWWKTIGAVSVDYFPPVEPITEWFTFDAVTARLVSVGQTPTEEQSAEINATYSNAFPLAWSGNNAKTDQTFEIPTMCEDCSLFSLLKYYPNVLPILKTLTNEPSFCLYPVPNSHFLLYNYSNYLRFAGDFELDSGYTTYLPFSTLQAPIFSKMTPIEVEAFRRYYLEAGSPFIQRGNAATAIFTFENNFIGLEWVDVTFRNIANNTMVATSSSGNYARNNQISTRLFMPTESRSFIQNSQIATNMCFSSMELRTLNTLHIEIVDPSGRHSLQNARLFFEIEFNQRNITPEESERADNFQNWTPQTPDDLEKILSRKKRRRSVVRIVS